MQEYVYDIVGKCQLHNQKNKKIPEGRSEVCMSNDISGSGTRYMVRWTYVYRRHTQPPVIRYNWEEMFVKLRQAINGRVLHIAVTLCSIYIHTTQRLVGFARTCGTTSGNTVLIYMRDLCVVSEVVRENDLKYKLRA